MTYQSYGGTRGWLARELTDTRKANKHEEKSMLYKCEVFTFGLLVLSVFSTSGRNPFEQDILSSERLTETALQLLGAKLCANGLDRSLTSTLEKFIRTILSANISQRSEIHRKMLGTSSSNYSVCFVSPLDRLWSEH